MNAFIRKHPVFTYYVLTFVISWGAILLAVGPGGFLSTTATSPAFPLVGVAALLGPSVAGLLATGLVGGKAGYRDLFSDLRRWRVGWRWYAVALLTAPLATLVTLALLSLATTPMVPGILTADDKAALLLTGVSTGLLVPVFEEVGWTGFATPRLLERHGIVATGILMGLLWGAWHLPLFAGSVAAAGEVPPALFLGTMLFSWLVPYRVLMVWAYARTRSVLLGMVMHVPIVVSQYVLNPEGISGKPLFLSLIVYSVALWLLVAAALASPFRPLRTE